MKQFFVQFSKEFQTLFCSVSAYIIVAAYYIFSMFSTFYIGDYFLRESEIMNAFFSLQPIMLTLIIPAITMRLWAEESKSGTLELLFTQPISFFKLVLAKFGAAFLFFVLLIISSVFLFWMSSLFSVLDYGIIYSGYCGLLLCGALFTAIGCLISALCKNNILSYIYTIFALFVLTQFELTSLHAIPLSDLNFEYNYNAFLSGILAWNNVFYFVIGILLCLWLNIVALEYKRTNTSIDKKCFYFFTFLLFSLFFCSVLSVAFIWNQSFDITDEKKYTLNSADKAFLQNLDKRIDITLYESKNQRQNANSSYAVYATFIEKILKLIEKYSEGAVRIETVWVEPFSQLEQRFVHKHNIPFATDKFEQKIFMAAEFSSNEGGTYFINAFSNLRQNLLETDLMRALKIFNAYRPQAVVVASEKDLNEMRAFQGILQEFYQVKYVDKPPFFIPPEYKFVIVINPLELSTEALLAMEQYILNGGTLIVFAEPKMLNASQGKPLINFLQNFGISPVPAEIIKDNLTENHVTVFPSNVSYDNLNQDIRSVIVNEAGKINFKNGETYKILPILKTSNAVSAAISEGKYTSNYLNMALDGQHIEPSSIQDGRVLFFYDTDLLKDYLFVSSESKGTDFYQIVPTADNMLFLLRLFDFAANANIENSLSYNHYALNKSSIGNAILDYINQYHKDQIQKLEANIRLYNKRKEDFYNNLKSRGFASIKNIGDISSIEQKIDENQNQLYKIKSDIARDYQSAIMIFTVILTFVVPLLILGILIIFNISMKKIRVQKIRRLIDAAQTH